MKKRSSASLNVPLAVTASAQAAATVSKRGNPVMSYLAGQYNSLPDSAKAQWNFANNNMQSTKDPKNSANPGVNGWTLFYSCNASLTAAKQPITLAPFGVNVPPALPAIRVQITSNSILLLPSTLTPYDPGPTIALWATIGVAQGNNVSSTTFKGHAFRHIGQITGGLPLAGVNIASQYLSVFPSIPNSCKIGFKLMAYNPGGYHTPKLFTVGLTPLLAMTGAATGEDDLQLAMGE